MRKFGLATILLIAVTGSLYAENWPHWRGPSSTGISPEKGLPAAWSDKQNVAWKANLRGLGISSPIVWGERVFVTSQLGDGGSRSGPTLTQGGAAQAAGERALGSGSAAARDSEKGVVFLVTALDRDSGDKLWEYELPAEGDLPEVHEKHNLATPSPVTDGQRVYAWFGSGQFVALDVNGKLVWQKNLAEEYGPFSINWGHGSSPVVYKDMVILLCYHQTTSYLLALDSRSGKVRWKADREQGTFSYSTPVVIETGDTAEILVNSSVGVSGHDVASGKMLWHVDETNRFPIPVPVLHDGVIYTSRGYRSSPYMAIRTGGKGDISESHVLWKVPTGAPYISSLVYYEGLIYMIGDVGIATVIDAKTGERIWQERVGGVYTASPIAADGKVYFFSENGETIVLAAGRNPRIISRNKLDARLLASPAVSEGKLFLRSDDSIYAIGE